MAQTDSNLIPPSQDTAPDGRFPRSRSATEFQVRCQTPCSAAASLPSGACTKCTPGNASGSLVRDHQALAFDRPSFPRVNTDLKGLQHAVCFLVLFIPEPPECPFRMALAVYGLPGRGAPGGPQSASSSVAPNPCFGHIDFTSILWIGHHSVLG